MNESKSSKRWFGTDGLKTLLLVLYPLLAAVVVPIGLAGARTGLRGSLFEDPAHELGVLWGIFSLFGVLVWAAATACCGVGWVFLNKTLPSHRLRPWFLASTVLSGALAIDDTFLLHDLVLPEYVGIPEVLVLFGYAAAIVWYLVRFRRELLDRPDSAVFAASMLLLGLSLAIDVAVMVVGPFPFDTTAEELPKLFGITAWLYFFFRATIDVLAHTRRSSS